MLSRTIIIGLLLTVSTASVLAQTGLVSQAITVSNNAGRSQLLTFGLDPAATNGLDRGLGEEQLPPAPPSGVFDGRLVGEDLTAVNLGQGSWVDYRQGDQSTVGTRIHELKYQPGSGTTIKITWNWPSYISGVLQDIITGTLINVPMGGRDSFTVANPAAFSKLKMTITYDMPLPIQLANFNATIINSSTVRLSWTTLSEINNYGFHVQRSPDFDTGYSTITSSVIPGNGTTNVPHSYEYDHTAAGSGTWYYRLEQIDLDGTLHYSGAIEIRMLTGAEEQGGPQEFGLDQNYPNPFNPATTFGFRIADVGFVTLKVYDAIGREVATLVNETKRPGQYKVRWDAGTIAGGVYLFRLRSGESVSTGRLILLR